MDSKLNKDILYTIAAELASAGSIDDLKNVSLTCRILRMVTLPLLFHKAQWPHPEKHTEEGGLEFFPETLWAYFREFSLDWPDHWPDTIPPQWGDRYYIGGDYHPRHLDKLVGALPAMSNLSRFHISCPFYPPASIIAALIQCPSIRELSIHDTPLYVDMVPRVPPTFHLDRLSIVPVAEALRVGEGAYDPKYQEFHYYTRDYRKRYRNDSLARYAATAFIFSLGKSDHLRHVEVSGDLCTLHELAYQEWPLLETLVLTGHAPRPHGMVELVDVVAKMPRLADLRLLFASVKNDPLFRLLPIADNHLTARGNSARVLSQIQYLAVSNACKIPGVFQYTTGLEGLVVCAIIDLPRVPIALGRAEVDALLNDMISAPGGMKDGLRTLRIMIEDKGTPELYRKICMHFPKLETLEVELCGYHDGKTVFPWEELVDPFRSLNYLKQLRICVQFPEYDEADRGEPWKTARRECAAHFAMRLPSLQRVGFEYRKRTGTHRYEDSWLEWDIERKQQFGSVELYELPPSWYRFPEVWKPQFLVGS
ncbi:hypothetical protein CC1G_08494 [Coprinopsis cinerea okayama7|uniref:Uncharacterized protein n=1 Tax=Coprinopsis cinerea (strain Okayama-7 / 130 / ATCC MYA-4618 / FGSC 9003) TaxID=240176 RepID=A8NM55_COPC7|nr:hypothetical protein CC1G_08494 [Coprinopsis cinerea okayama7\|eukprot:XP_001834849.1 hypothetical protein CC1G_08494 [Coprinopsis cinerea okayama7\